MKGLCGARRSEASRSAAGDGDSRREVARRARGLLSIGAVTRRLLALFLLSLSSCLQLEPADDTAATAATAGTSGTTSSPTTATGVNCGSDPSSGVTLCLGISTCPGVSVDPDQLSGCGFRVSGSTLDLECVCGDYLCPVGPPASCSDAKSLLADETTQGACTAVSDGRCTALTTNASTGTSSSCDTSCRSDCDGEPACITACGC